VAKAFDGVSHDTLRRALRRLRVPEPLAEYVGHMYTDTHLPFSS